MIGAPGCSLLFDQPGDPPLNQPADGGEDGEGCQRHTHGDFMGESGSSRYLLIDCEFNKGLRQDRALARCQELGGALAVFETTAEHQFLLDAISQNPILRGTDHLIALRYVAGTGFSWAGSPSPVAFFCSEDGCGPTFPDFAQDSCFVMDFAARGSWNSYSCGNSDDYICEIPL